MQTWRITLILLELLDSSDEDVIIISPLETVLIEDNNGKKIHKDNIITFRHNVN